VQKRRVEFIGQHLKDPIASQIEVVMLNEGEIVYLGIRTITCRCHLNFHRHLFLFQALYKLLISGTSFKILDLFFPIKEPLVDIIFVEEIIPSTGEGKMVLFE
jgi:hypothetical protein